jgi:hypothetical protein
MVISRLFLHRVRNVSDESCRENQNTHFMFKLFFSKIYRLWDHLEKYSIVGQATGDNTTHALYMLGNQGYKHTLGIRITYCFCAARMVARTRLSLSLCCVTCNLAVLCVTQGKFTTHRVKENGRKYCYQICVVVNILTRPCFGVIQFV